MKLDHHTPLRPPRGPEIPIRSGAVLLFSTRHAARGTRLAALFALCLSPFALSLTALAEEPPPFARTFDTRSRSESALTSEAVAKRDGWRLIPEGTLAHDFAGDAVLANDKLAVVLRLKWGCIDAYAATTNGWKHRAALRHVGAGSSAFDPPESLKIIDNNPGAAMVEMAYRPAQATLRLRLTTGESILEIRPGDGVHSVDVQTSSLCVLVPDFFADDMVFLPDDPKLNGALLPAENFFLCPIEGGDAMLMAVWQSGGQDVTLSNAGVTTETSLCSTRITLAKGKSLWLAFLEQPGIWAMEATRQPPFPAKWRCSFCRDWGRAAFATSWDMERGPAKDQPSASKHGLAVTYPIDRSRATPLTVYTPMDVLRNTLGVGPCQYILQSEGLAAQGSPTPDNVMDWVEKQFKQGKDKQASDEIREHLNQMLEHMARERARIERYSVPASEPLELKGGAGVDASLILQFVTFKTLPSSELERAGPPDLPAKLAGRVVALIGKENAFAECEKLGAELRAIGAKLDGALSRCRMRTRWLRQQCRMAAIREPRSAELPKLIQQRAERMLEAK